MPLREKALIARIRRQASITPGVVAGIGDDAAVLRLPPGHQALITTDLTLEGIHFRREWHSPESVGHRCLVRGLSDIAAMGGIPIAAFLSLAVPSRLPQNWVDRFLRGLLGVANKFKLALAGGDTAESRGGIVADMVVLGSAPKGKAIRRSGAKPGDRIYVSGGLGGAGAAIRRMRENPGRKLSPRDYQQHFFPQPRLEVGRILRARGLASAMIDLSDGLSTDLAHICEESGAGAKVRAESIPLAKVGKPARFVDLQLALYGGEDYELLFTARAHARIPASIAGVRITEIGRIVRGRAILLLNQQGAALRLEPQGWEHFRPSSR